ncbi:MAG TPA: hypothetical protein VIL09_19625 [Microvirga sp.]|jgi:hypothetical protein
MAHQPQAQGTSRDPHPGAHDSGEAHRSASPDEGVRHGGSHRRGHYTPTQRRDPGAMRRGGQAQGSGADALANGLGWFSIGLGLAEVLMPGRLAGFLGMRGQERLIQGYGLREIANGIGLLAARDKGPWLWGRVGGDALDLATLAGNLGEGNRRRENVGIAMAAVAGVTALDIYAAQMHSQSGAVSGAVSGAMSRLKGSPSAPPRDFSDRTGFPKGVQAARGAAKDFKVPDDMRTPEALRALNEKR